MNSFNTFNELCLSEALLRGITELGFEKPSEIQAQAIPLLLAASGAAGSVEDETGVTGDFIGLAATGTGKTAAFAIPLLERVDPSQPGVQALVLCPTRELALQVAGQIDLLGKYMGVQALPVYGGTGYTEQLRGLRRGATIVVGTPGRVIDHLEKGALSLSGLSTLVLDEADEMISMGFKDELEAILAAVPTGQARTWLFSATMSREVRRVADRYLREPAQVQVNRKEMLAEGVEQICYLTQESNKPEVLCKLIDMADDIYGIIFCQTKALVVDLTRYLSGRGYAAECLHGDMTQNERERAMKAFRERKVTLLVCTDVASRGLDVKDITHVINYSVPRELDVYVHRIGRTARSGKSGIAMSLATGSQRGLIRRIEQVTKSTVHEGRIPTRKEIGAKKISRLLERFETQTGFERAIELMGEGWKEAIAAMSVDEVAGRFLAMMYPEIFVEKSQDEPSDFAGTRLGRATREEKSERGARDRRESGGGAVGVSRPARLGRPGRPDRSERLADHRRGVQLKMKSGLKIRPRGEAETPNASPGIVSSEPRTGSVPTDALTLPSSGKRESASKLARRARRLAKFGEQVWAPTDENSSSDSDAAPGFKPLKRAQVRGSRERDTFSAFRSEPRRSAGFKGKGAGDFPGAERSGSGGKPGGFRKQFRAAAGKGPGKGRSWGNKSPSSKGSGWVNPPKASSGRFGAKKAGGAGHFASQSR